MLLVGNSKGFEEGLSFVQEFEYLLCCKSQNWSFQEKRAPLSGFGDQKSYLVGLITNEDQGFP